MEMWLGLFTILAWPLMCPMEHLLQTCGNLPDVNLLQACDKVTRNIARILRLCDSNVPYHKGCERPFLGELLPESSCTITFIIIYFLPNIRPFKLRLARI